MKGRWIKYTADQLAFIKANCILPRSELTQFVNAKFGTHYTLGQIKSLCTRKGWKTGRDGKFYAGQAFNPNSGAKGPNRTSFKKGHKPANANPLGHVRKHDEYYQIKVFDTGNSKDDYIECHRLVWQYHHGPIPAGHIVIFVDGDTSNIEIDNLRCITRGAHAIINKQGLRKVPRDALHASITLGQVIDKTSQRAKA